MPSVNYYSNDYWIRRTYKCKYCKGTNLKSASRGNFCCDCRKSSNYFEKEIVWKCQ